MDDRHVMRLIKAAEKIATDLDRIAAALEAANAADPVAMVAKAVEAHAAEVEAQAKATALDPTYVKPPEWMLRNG